MARLHARMLLIYDIRWEFGVMDELAAPRVVGLPL